MTALKYTVIKSIDQYNTYCKVLEQLLDTGSDDSSTIDEVDLLTLLIEKYDEANNTFREFDPIALLRSFMTDHNVKANDLVDLLGVSKGYVSDILNYKKGLSKDVIRKLAERFNVAQEAFNRPYQLHVPENTRLRNASVMNTTKELAKSLVFHSNF